jgi:integration host factor subunit beta
MTKGELIAHIAHQYPPYTPQAVEMMLNALLEQVATTLAQGERIELRGFGSFTVRERAARTGRNPRTGASVAVAARRVPVFKAAKELRQRIEGLSGARNEGAPRSYGYEGEQSRAALAGQAASDA